MLIDGRFAQRTNTGQYSSFELYPTSEQGWVDRYDRLLATYLGEPYDISEIKHFHLFRALDDDGNDIDITKRLTTLYRFIVNTDVGAFLGGRLTLELAGNGEAADPLRAAQLAAGEAVWRRSRLDERLEVWVRSMAVMGDHYIEAVRMSARPPYKTTLVGYDCRNVVPVYDQETGTQLLRVVVTQGYYDPPTVGQNGVVEEGAGHVYRREIDAEEIKVFVDGVFRADLSGPHGLGVVPVVHVQWTPFSDVDHGLPAAAGVDQACMVIDSMVTQVKAIANRHANPLGYVKGALIDTAGAAILGKFGRWFTGLPADSDVGYIEATGGMIGEIIAQTSQLLTTIQQTEPEFLFADNGTSGEAKSYKASALENKIGTVRARFFAALSRVLGYAVALDANALATDDETYKIDAPPILPRNTKTELEMVKLIKDDLTPGDYVRHLQRLGLVGREHDPEAYAAEVAAGKVVVTPTNATGDDAKPTDEAPPPDGVAPGEVAPGEVAPAEAPKAYNGIQITAANTILQAVAAGTMAADLAQLQLETFLLVPANIAAEMVRRARSGAGGEPAPVA